MFRLSYTTTSFIWFEESVCEYIIVKFFSVLFLTFISVDNQI